MKRLAGRILAHGYPTIGFAFALDLLTEWPGEAVVFCALLLSYITLREIEAARTRNTVAHLRDILSVRSSFKG